MSAVIAATEFAEALPTALAIIQALLGTAATLQAKVAAGTITKADNDAAMVTFDLARAKLAADIQVGENLTPIGNPPLASNSTPVGAGPVS